MSNYDKEKDLRTQGSEDTLKGKLNKAAGKVQRKAGETIDNQEMQAKGTAREFGGKVQDKMGQAERKADRALRDDEK